MWTWHILWLSFSQYILAVWAADPPFDFEKAPGGGPSTLRACAQYAFVSNSRAGSIYNLGCQTISCVCRSDLVQQAHDSITAAVAANCGKDATVDIQQAINIYNAYCSANGYAIPGYTYTSTLTLPAATSFGQTTPSRPLSTSLGSGVTSTGISSLPNPKVTTTVVVPESTATVTATMIIKSQGTKVQPWGILQLLYLVPILPIRYIHALAESVIVTYTQPAPSTDVPVVVVTTFMSVQAVPAATIVTVYDNNSRPSVQPISPTTVATVNDNNSQSTATSGSQSSSDQPATGGGGGGPTKLELVGIIVGIIGGIITTVATVWMCLRK